MADLEFLALATGADGSELHPLLGDPLQPDHVIGCSRAQEAAGFDGVLVTETASSAHAVALGGQIAAVTERMRVIMAARAGVTMPTSLHRALTTLDCFHPGRTGIYLPPVDSDEEYRREGDHSTRQQRQDRRAEFVDVVRRLGAGGAPLHHEGRHYWIDGAWTPMRPAAPIPLYLSGLSTAADELAARSADVYLLPSEPTVRLRARIARVNSLSTRPVRFGLRLRPVLGAAPADARRLADQVLRSRRVGERSPMLTATGALDDARELIGTTGQLADTLLRYAQLGITVFQLHGFEPSADVPRFAELISAVRSRSVGVGPSPATALAVPA